jgi:AcrR family transcriptional regulator
MGIASPSLYAAFGCKEELFRQVLQLYSAVRGPEIWAGVARAPTAYAAVESYLMQTAKAFTQRNQPPGCLVVLSALHATDQSEPVRRELIAMREKNVEDMEARLEAGVATGEISATANLAAIARYYVTVQQGMSIQAHDGATRRQLECVARAALAAWKPLTSAPG